MKLRNLKRFDSSHEMVGAVEYMRGRCFMANRKKILTFHTLANGIKIILAILASFIFEEALHNTFPNLSTFVLVLFSILFNLFLASFLWITR